MFRPYGTFITYSLSSPDFRQGLQIGRRYATLETDSKHHYPSENSW